MNDLAMYIGYALLIGAGSIAGLLLVALCADFGVRIAWSVCHPLMRHKTERVWTSPSWNGKRHLHCLGFGGKTWMIGVIRARADIASGCEGEKTAP